MSIFLFMLPPPPDERPDDLVGVRYVAARFGCGVSSVYARKGGTENLRPVTTSPMRFRRGDVDEEVRRLIEDARPKKKSFRLLTRSRRSNVA